jgi:hypothetical protein
VLSSGEALLVGAAVGLGDGGVVAFSLPSSTNVLSATEGAVGDLAWSVGPNAFEVFAFVVILLGIIQARIYFSETATICILFTNIDIEDIAARITKQLPKCLVVCRQQCIHEHKTALIGTTVEQLLTSKKTKEARNCGALRDQELLAVFCETLSMHNSWDMIRIVRKELGKPSSRWF